MSTTDVLYERFKKNLEAADGECSAASKADAAKVVAELFRDKGVKQTCVAESDFLRELGIVPALREAGIGSLPIISARILRLYREAFRRFSTGSRISEP